MSLITSYLTVRTRDSYTLDGRCVAQMTTQDFAESATTCGVDGRRFLC